MSLIYYTIEKIREHNIRDVFASLKTTNTLCSLGKIGALFGLKKLCNH